jgi:hypothetical protein
VPDAPRTLRCPLKCCSSFISRRARFAKIFLLKTLVTFLIATPSWVWEFVAALWEQELANTQLTTQSRNALPDNSVSTLTKLFSHRISLIDNEVLVENLEHLSSHEVCHCDCWYRTSRFETKYELSSNFRSRANIFQADLRRIPGTN